MFRGVIVVSFDYRLGPIVEAMFPEGVIPRDAVWNFALDIWMSIFSREVTEDSNQKVYGDLGRLAIISFCENSENYALIALFDDGDGGAVWQLKDALKEVMSRAVEALKKGSRSIDVARSVYDDINGLIAGPRKFPVEVYERFREIYDALGKVLSVLNEVKDDEVKGKLLSTVSELTDKISDLALNLALTWGDRDIISAILRRAEGKS
ncbi:MAG: hypothetical protein QXN15_04180 [Candidatus Jordarchaeales archaeon]|nr:hypothetical protein [Candidatus Jordarchaeia archaeon]